MCQEIICKHFNSTVYIILYVRFGYCARAPTGFAAGVGLLHNNNQTRYTFIWVRVYMITAFKEESKAIVNTLEHFNG